MLAQHLDVVPIDGNPGTHDNRSTSEETNSRGFAPEISPFFAPALSRFALTCHGLLYGAVTYGTLKLVTQQLHQAFTEPYRILGALAALLVYFNLRNVNLSVAWHIGRVGSLGNRMLITWLAIVAGLLFMGYCTERLAYFSRTIIGLWFVVTPAALVIVNSVARFIAGQAEAPLCRRAVLINANGSACQFVENAERSGAYDVVGYFGERGHSDEPDALGRLRFLGAVNSAGEYVRAKNIDVVFIFLPKLHGSEARWLLDDLGNTTASIYYVPQLEVFSDLKARMISVESMPMLEVIESPLYGADGLLKRVFDIALSLTALLVLGPLLMLVGVAVLASSPGPIIFRQKRYGLNGRPFSIYKFRTMAVQQGTDTLAEVIQAKRGDMRVTAVGRLLRSTSLDELPQLLNVLRGDMSLVGPRPHAVVHNEFYRKVVPGYMLRHKVKPGLTGLAQVKGCRGETAQLGQMAERVRWDMEYIRKWTPMLDLSILIRTARLVISRKNAY
jgi:putative colanic acid biosynthesis UDP-glucose lipid carrier transferase